MIEENEPLVGAMKRARHASETREKIIRETRLLMQEHGYDKTTIRMILHRCGIKNSTLYHFFKNKEDIFNHIVLGIMERVHSQTDHIQSPNPVVGFLREVCWYYFSILQNKRNAELYLLTFGNHEVVSIIKGKMAGRFSELVEDGRVDEAEVPIILQMILGFLQSLAARFLNGEEVEEEVHAVSLCRLTLRLVGANPLEVKSILNGFDFAQVKASLPEGSILST
ncbi:MAG: TetR/AcrR family transcriptional regulator [Bacteroidota bacterium]